MTLEREEYMLDDEDIRNLSEGANYTEGGTLDGFLEEAKVVVEALKAADAQSDDKRVQLLALMRGFYFLGILRGGESYRADLEVLEELKGRPCENKELRSMSFELSDTCAELFNGDLENLTPSEWEQVNAIFGVLN